MSKDISHSYFIDKDCAVVKKEKKKSDFISI